MVSKRFSLLAPLAIVCVSLWGCGGGTNIHTDTTGSALTRAETQLNQMSSGLQSADDTTLNATLSLFNDALKQNPRSPQALFGQAICQAGITAGSLETNSGMPVSAATAGSGSVSAGGLATSTGQATLPTPGNEPYTGSLVLSSTRPGLLWHLGEGVGNPNTLLMPLAPVANLRYGLISLYGYAGDDVANRQQALQQLNVVTQNLQTLEANPDFATTLIIVGSPRGDRKSACPKCICSMLMSTAFAPNSPCPSPVIATLARTTRFPARHCARTNWMGELDIRAALSATLTPRPGSHGQALLTAVSTKTATAG